MSILSIQSHVAYGYVGNRAAVYPLQNMGYDVWPVNTVQFSNHTGYGQWKGEHFSAQHIEDVVTGIEELGVADQCQAILSGYLGTGQIGQSILNIVARFKARDTKLIYLCDPVIGDVGRGVFVKPEVLAFFKENLCADIITPNHFEAEILTDITIKTLKDAKAAADCFHQRGIKIVVITSLRVQELVTDKIYVLVSDQGKITVAEAPLYLFDIAPTGTGDLFSALYLGCYLKHHNSATALKEALSLMDAVMFNTFQKQTRELALLAVDYRVTPSAQRVKLL